MIHGYAVGDLHLNKSNLGAMFDDADGMTLAALKRVFDRALKEGVPFVVLLGDVSDTPVLSDRTRALFITLLQQYDGRLDIRIILGNHDVSETAVHSLHSLETLSKLGLFKTVKFFTEHTVEEYNGITLEYMAWPAEKPRAKNSICFAHFEVSGATRDNGRQVKEGHDATFKRRTNHFVQGHLHTPHSVRNHWYVGTLMQMSFGERLPKGYGEFRAKADKATGEIKFQKRHVKWQPPWCLHNVVLNSKADLKDYPRLLESFGPNPRVKLFVADGLKVPEDFLLQHPEIVNRLEFKDDKDLAELQAEELELETSSLLVSHTDLLPHQLKTQGASRRQIRRALEIIEGFTP